MTTPTNYVVPDNPADPEAAAGSKLIVRMPSLVMHTEAFTTVLQDYCGALHAEGAFAGLVLGRRETDRGRGVIRRRDAR
jgi:hypothetical protein